MPVSDLTPRRITGTTTKKAMKSEMMRAGVRSWYRLRMPPVGREVFVVDGAVKPAA